MQPPVVDYLDIARKQLPLDEGWRAKPYRDTTGHLTIGIGRNLDGIGLRAGEIQLMFENDLHDADRLARSLVPSFDALSEERKAVLVNMAFNLGGQLGAFANTLHLIAEGRWADAATAMLNSLWAKQVPERAHRLAAAMRGTSERSTT